MKLTVLLLRPDYVADNYGQDTYTAHVEVPSITKGDWVDAVRLARKEACRADQMGFREFGRDYHVLAVFKGHLEHLEYT